MPNSDGNNPFSAMQLIKGVSLQLAGGTIPIGSLTIDSTYFTGNITVYNGTSAGLAMWKVASGQTKTLPIGGSVYSVYLVADAGSVGNAYVQWSQTSLTGSTNNTPQIINTSTFELNTGSIGNITSYWSISTIAGRGQYTSTFYAVGISNPHLKGSITYSNAYLLYLSVSNLPNYVRLSFSTAPPNISITNIIPLIYGSGNLQFSSSAPLFLGTSYYSASTAADDFFFTLYAENYDSIGQLASSQIIVKGFIQ